MENRVIIEGVVITLTKFEADNYVSFALQNKQDIVLVYGCHIPDIDIDVDMTVRVIGRLRRHGNTVKVEASSIMRLS